MTGFIAAGFQIEKGKENKALTQAGKLAYDDIEAALLGAPISEAGKPKENGVGSYERFMRMTGNLALQGKMK